MKFPKRLLVVKRLCDLLETEPMEVDGKTYNMKGAVWRGRNILGEEIKPLPAISVLESPRPDFAIYAGEDEARRDNMTLLVTGLIESRDKYNPSDAGYWFHAAVEERLSRVADVKPGSGNPKYPEHYMLGDLLSSFDVGAPVVRPPDDKTRSCAYFFLPIRVGIATLVTEPYTQVP